MCNIITLRKKKSLLKKLIFEENYHVLKTKNKRLQKNETCTFKGQWNM